MFLTTLFQSLLSSVSVSCLSLHLCLFNLSTCCSCILSVSFFHLHCLKNFYLCCLSSRNTNEYASSSKHNPTPFITYPPRCFYHILAIGFILTRSQRKRQPYFSPPFLLQTRLSFRLIIVPDCWALIKALHLTNNTNDVRSQKQMESSQSYTGRG